MSFLSQVAKHLHERHEPDALSRVAVVLPSRRAVFFFKQELARQADRPFLAPDVWAIEDFVFEKTDLQPTDPVGLLFELFDVYRQLDPQVQFERFTGWASTLLGDFDRVDQYLVPAKAVFGWMSEAKALARWQLDQAWKPDLGSVVDKHFRLFAHLLPAYEGLRQRLLGQGLAYRGMAYRALAERPYECLLEPAQHDFYYFAGFNAFSRSEETFVRYLVDKNKAQTLWDADNYYFRPGMEAGLFLQRYQRESTFGGTFNWRSDALSQGEKHIQIIGVPNASMQPKVAGEIYRRWEEEKRVDSGQRIEDKGQRIVDSEKASSTIHSPTAIVLGDENLLMPLLFSLDESVSDFNVTMGVSLRNSMLFTLVDAWFDAQRNLVEIRTKEGEVKRIPKFSHRHILRLLSHPFIRRYEAGLGQGAGGRGQGGKATESASGPPLPLTNSPVQSAVRAITEQNLVFLTDKELIELGGGSELFRVLFTRWNDQPAVALRQCYKLVGLLREVYQQKDDALETEYLYLFFTLLKRLESLIDVRKKELFGMRPFRTLLFELIRQTSIPFSGEPVSDLQVMGMLETRALDFDRVIVMSVNEGSLPSGKRINSLIPFDAALEFGLPTHGDQDAVTAYHFFRLLQRAKEVVLIHTQPTGEGQRAEKSRFLLQIEHELARANPKIRLSYPTVEFQTATRPERVEAEGLIWKTPAMREFLLGDLAERGLYPSQLNNYLDCSMKFYFGRVAGLREEASEPEEQLGSDRFGEWLHKTLERIDRHLMAEHGHIGADALRRERDAVPTWLERTFSEVYPNLPFGQGVNHVQFLIARKLLTNFYDQQLSDASQFPIQIIGLEQKLSVDVALPMGEETIYLKVAGRLDRLDRTASGALRVIDYKTGKMEASDLKTGEGLETELLGNQKKGKLRQLWLYKYLATKQLIQNDGQILDQTFAKEQPVIAGIYSFRAIKEGLFGQQSSFAFTEGESPEAFLAASERQLGQFVGELLDPAKPYSRTNDRKICGFCGFARLCGR